MPTVQDHYINVLSDIYSWLYGGFDAQIKQNAEFFENHGIKPMKSGKAIDLGAGCGFQSIPLARAGFSVTAIDLDEKLLNELNEHAEGLDIRTIQDDLIRFDQHVQEKMELVVCMTDTLVHLESREKVKTLFSKVYDALEAGGKFILTFRDLTFELRELDRFLPVRSDENTVFTCFLEYEPETVKVHDVVYKRESDIWQLYKSFYRKLRLSPDRAEEQLHHAGFGKIESSIDKGFVTIISGR